VARERHRPACAEGFDCHVEHVHMSHEESLSCATTMTPSDYDLGERRGSDGTLIVVPECGFVDAEGVQYREVQLRDLLVVPVALAVEARA
jgi:hypothetical protein